MTGRFLGCINVRGPTLYFRKDHVERVLHHSKGSVTFARSLKIYCTSASDEAHANSGNEMAVTSRYVLPPDRMVANAAKLTPAEGVYAIETENQPCALGA